MKIVFYGYRDTSTEWISFLETLLPEATIEHWSKKSIQSADYFICRNPPADKLSYTYQLKGVFFLSAGVDYFLKLKQLHACKMLEQVPCYRLEDAGMSEQMMDYATYAVFKFFRQFDQYDKLKTWTSLPNRSKLAFNIGIAGAGVLGKAVAQRLVQLGFNVNIWSRTKKQFDNVTSYAGQKQFLSFLNATHILINLLPLHSQTQSIFNASVFASLAKPSYFINLARGEHVVESDLLQALINFDLAAAQIDVTQVEPLPDNSALYDLDNLYITPHNSAVTLMEESCRQVAEKIRLLVSGHAVSGRVEWGRGY